ncbi:helix-turn-helix transcriptional regulator [Lysobacter sp. GCM10012299]|uniref:helix-turn-helix transcriptional regulator n=1 Tax=Lysobacter sp. GCM10012299 TaxID=3317333 RepID=UPI003619B524
MTSQDLSIWVQMRAGSWVEAKEGRFYLRTGDWIAFAKDSMPQIQPDHDGICIGLTITEDALRAMARFSDFGLYVGRGRLKPGQARAVSRMWYRASRTMEQDGRSGRIQAPLRSMLLFLEEMQAEYGARLGLCPGASLGRKRQVFERMQRASLYLEGHCHRIVRISELAERTRFSTWYFSKLFHKLYGESPLAASARMRLDHAASLLASTLMTIGEVGAASGFDNSCSFARSFRARFGMTASEYRAARRDADLVLQRRRVAHAKEINAGSEAVRFARENVIKNSGIRLVGA